MAWLPLLGADLIKAFVVGVMDMLVHIIYSAPHLLQSSSSC